MTHFCADAIVVLGGLVYPDGSLSNALRRRVQKGALAFHQGLAPFVLCSGGKSWNGHIEALRMRDYLLELKVDPNQIITELHSHCTAENAWYCAGLFRSRCWRRAVLVSCPWHLQRASLNFRACGIDVSPLGSDCPPLEFHSNLWRAGVEFVSARLDLARIRRWKSL
jgi:uncharacterized SAM-binding protein YcdF (DUF218 family)